MFGELKSKILTYKNMGILYVTRHGETEYNRLGLFIGQKEIELNKKGVFQAHELGKRAKLLGVDFVLSSSLIRSMQTAEIVKDYIGKEIKVDGRLIERNVGVLEGLTMEELKEFQRGCGHDMEKVYNEIIPESETSQQVQKRVFEAIDDIKINYPDKTILVITHSFVMKMINKHFSQDISAENFFKFSVNNTEIKKFDY